MMVGHFPMRGMARARHIFPLVDLTFVISLRRRLERCTLCPDASDSGWRVECARSRSGQCGMFAFDRHLTLCLI